MGDQPIVFIPSWKELPEDEQKLLERALANQENAYAPYSNFHVGAAIRMLDGRIIDGFNIENAAYPLCICAERAAIAHALTAHPDGIIEKLAVIGGETESVPFPCGSCRQVMVEMAHRQKRDFRVLIGSATGSVYVTDSPKALLPFAFDPGFLI